MAKKKKKPTRKPSRKPARPAKKMRSKAPARKKKPVKKLVKKRARMSGGTTIEFTEIEVISGIGEDAMDETELAVAEPLDEHFPPDYGGSE
jgi:hypothetical protein